MIKEKQVEIGEIPVILLAGGLGTRLRSILPDMPKVMAEIKGKPFLEWLLLFMREFGFRNFIISVGYLAEKIETYFKKQRLDVKIRFLREDTPLGTGGAIILASKEINTKDLIAMNGDSIIMVDFRRLLDFYYEKRPDMLIVVKKAMSAGRYGAIEVDNNRITGFYEKVKKGTFINAGMYLFRKDVLTQFHRINNYPVSIEKDVIPLLVKDGDLKIMAFETEGDFLDIGTPESFASGDEFLERNILKHGCETSYKR